jgi:site-specific DNA-methyltransferase (adenine-specific)
MDEEVRSDKKIIAWDVAPGKEYFNELFRVSRNQIIWGGNYFELPATRCFLIWKKTNIPEAFTMAMCEYAWTSFNDNAKVFEFSAANQPCRFHPTQKPVELYKWILNNYAERDDVILDTHAGSASSLVACHETGHKYVGFEIDAEYYSKAMARLEREEAQMNIFTMGSIPYQEG